MTDAKDATEATAWCKTARDLLGKRKDKSKPLKAAKEQIIAAADKCEKLLEKLKDLNAGLHTTYLAEFTKYAGQLHDAIGPRNLDENAVIAVGKQLAQLNLTLTATVSNEQELAKEIKKFDTAYTKQEPLVATAGALRGALLPGSTVQNALKAAARNMDEAWTLREQAETEHSAQKIVAAAQKLADVTQNLADAKAGAKLAEKEASADLGFMGEWAQLKPLVEKEIAQLRQLPGAEAQVQTLQDMLDRATGLMVNQDGVWRGYKAACTELTQHALVLQQGKNAHDALMKKGQPKEVVDALEAVRKALELQVDLAPDYARESLDGEATALAELGRRDAANAVLKLKALALQIDGETQRLTTDKKAAEDARTELDKLVKDMITNEAPESLYGAARLTLQMVDESDRVGRAWASAARRYKVASQTLQSASVEFANHGDAWGEKRAAVVRIRTLAVNSLGFPAVSIFAQALRDTSDEVFKIFQRFDIPGSINAFDTRTLIVSKSDGKGGDGGTTKMTLTQAETELRSRLTAGKIPAEDKGKREGFTVALKLCTGQVNTILQQVETKVRSYIDGLTDVDPKLAGLLERSLGEQLQAVMESWLEVRTSASDAGTLETAAAKAIKALNKVIDDQAKTRGSMLVAQLSTLEQKRIEANNDAAPARMTKLLERCRAMGINVDAEERDVLAQANAKVRDYRDIYARLEEKWGAEQTRRTLAKQTVNKQVINGIDAPLRDLPVSKTYKKELEQASLDVKYMIGTPDSELLEIARGMKDRLKTQIDQINANPEQYKKNKELLEALAPRIGALLDKLPDTNRRLQTRLTEEEVESKHSAPQAMILRIKLLTKEVEAGEQELKDRDIAVAEYRTIKKKVRDTFDEMKKATATRVTEKSDAFEAWYESRIAEAKSLKGQQGKIPEAKLILEEIQTRLDTIIKNENPRAKLREFDAAEVQNVRTMQDLSQQWQKDVALFLEVTLPKVKAANKEGEDGDTTTVSGLEQLVSSAGKVVGSYLKTLTWHEIGGVDGPDIKKVKADFAQARQMLGDAQRSAMRLLETPQSTNVRGPAKDGLGKLLRKWTQNTRAYAATLREVAQDVRTAGKDDAEKANQDNAAKASQLIESLAGLFPSDAFSASFAVLMQDPAQVAKEQRPALERKQLSEREAVLRQMRQSRGDLAHPLLMKLGDAAFNPFDSASVTVAVSGLSTTLKEIELQALASA